MIFTRSITAGESVKGAVKGTPLEPMEAPGWRIFMPQHFAFRYVSCHDLMGLRV